MQKWPLLLLLLLLIGCALADVGIGPAHIKLVFDNTTSSQTLTLYAINLGDSSTKVKISADGELAKFVSFGNTTLQLSAGETRPFEVTIALPQNYSRGNYELYVNIAELAGENPDSTGFVAQSVSSTTVSINKLSGLLIAQESNQTLQNKTNTQANGTNNTPRPNFVVSIPSTEPEQKNLFELFTGMFTSPLSKLSKLTWQQWLIAGLFIIALILLISYLTEPNRPRQPQLFAYQPRYQYPSSQYPQQPGYGYRR
jgi:hypothetical protein